MQKKPHGQRKRLQNIFIRSFRSIQKSSISFLKDTISPTQLLSDVIIHHLTNQLNKDLEDEHNNSSSFLATYLLKSSAINLNLSNTAIFLEKTNKLLFLAIYLPDTHIFKLKQSNKINSFDKKPNLNLVFDDVLKICRDKLDFLE